MWCYCVDLGLCVFDMVVEVGVVMVIVCGVTVWVWLCVDLIWMLKLELWWGLCVVVVAVVVTM